MKVISIKEPFATLLTKNIKHIETRSWKTKYRGELYIHASKKTWTKKHASNALLELTKDLEFNYGNIIGKGTLVDCIYMDEAFIEEIKNNPQEYACGEYKVGRYAWILENVEAITPIPAKGQLNIWNYNEENNKEKRYIYVKHK